MAVVNMDEDVPITPDDMGDLSILPNLGGLSRLTTDPVSQPPATEPPEAAAAADHEENDGLGALVDLKVLPNLKGLARLQTDPAQQTTLTPDIDNTSNDHANEDGLPSFDLPNLSGLHRLQTDPVQNPTENKTDTSCSSDLELIPIRKLYNTPKIMKLLQNGLDSDFMNWDIFDVYSIASHYTLTICCKYLFNKLDLFNKLNIAEDKLLSFVRKIESGYLDLPYHNALHAADVMINAYHYLIASRLITNDLDVMCVLIAALCHDYKHPGVQSTFLIESNDAMVTQYGDESVLEHMHIAETFAILTQNAYNFMENGDEMKYVKQCVRDMILATDMAIKHEHHMKKMEELLTDAGAHNSNDLMCIGLHAADVASVCKKWKLFEEWAKRLVMERFSQGDKEREMGLKVSLHCDIQKDSNRINETHSEFITALMMPFYHQWSILFQDKPQFAVWYKQLCKNNEKLTTRGIKL